MSESGTENQDRLATEDEQQSRTVSSGDSTAMGSVVMKSCCMCGTDLNGRTRYKDATGRYWCPVCNEKDRLSKEAAVCPDCNGNFTKADLVDFKGTGVCSGCWEKRRASARREEARLRAVEEEMREQEERTRRWKLIIGGILLVLLIWSAAYAAFWFLARS